jgi:F-type H+-transporting ATPase subunit alpha
MVAIRPDEISSIIQQQIEQYDQDVKVSERRNVCCKSGMVSLVIYGLRQGDGLRTA